MEPRSAYIPVGRFVALVAVLGQVSCGGSQPAAPSTTPIGPFTISGPTSLGELHQFVQLTLLAGGLDATRNATWKSSNVSVASALSTSAGQVQAIGFGTATISATYQNQTTSVDVSVVPDEDCGVYDPTSVMLIEQTSVTPSVWSVGALNVQLGFVELFVAGENIRDGNNLVALFQRYSQECTIGHTSNNNRQNRVQYTFTYFKSPTGKQTTISPEDCVPYSPGTLQIVNQSPNGWALMSSGVQLALLDSPFDAALMSSIAGQYSNECFIGRGNTRPNPYDYITEYWK